MAGQDLAFWGLKLSTFQVHFDVTFDRIARCVGVARNAATPPESERVLRCGVARIYGYATRNATRLP